MRHKIARLFALGALMLLAACSLPRGVALKTEITGQQAVDSGIQVVEVSRNSAHQVGKWPSAGWHGHYHWFSRVNGPGNRVIKPGDKVTLTIWDNQENSLLLPAGLRSSEVPPTEVSQSGTIFIPYIEQVLVGGLTPEQAREVIQQKMASIAPSVQVQLELTSGVRNSVDLVDGIVKPGKLELPDRNTSILTAFSLGGGIDPALDNPVVRLIRDTKKYEIPAKALLEDPAKNVILRGGDQIVIVEDSRYFIGLGATQTESQLYFKQDDISVMEALSMLGGLQDARANPQGVLVLRQYPASAVRTDGTGPSSEYVVFVVDLTDADSVFGANRFHVQSRDIVMATESAIKPAQAVIALAGSLFAINNIFE